MSLLYQAHGEKSSGKGLFVGLFWKQGKPNPDWIRPGDECSFIYC